MKFDSLEIYESRPAWLSSNVRWDIKIFETFSKALKMKRVTSSSLSCSGRGFQSWNHSSVKNPLTKLNLGRKFLQSTDFCPLHIDFPSDFIMKQPVGMVAPTLTLRRWIQIFMVACKSLAYKSWFTQLWTEIHGLWCFPSSLDNKFVV